METPTVEWLYAGETTFGAFDLGAPDSPLALCLHGFPDSPHTWLHDVAPALVDAGYRVVAPFMRGYGPSQGPKNTRYGAEELAQDVLAMIDAAGADEAVLIGHDWGGFASHVAAALEPDKVRATVAIDSPHPAEVKRGFSGLFALRHLIVLQFKKRTMDWLRKNNFQGVNDLYAHLSPNWKLTRKDLAPVKKALAQPGSVEAALSYLWHVRQDYRARRIRKKFSRKISVPSLTLTGSDSPVTLESVKGAKKFYTKHKLVELPDAGHWVHREAPRATVDTLLSFLGKHAPA